MLTIGTCCSVWILLLWLLFTGRARSHHGASLKHRPVLGEAQPLQRAQPVNVSLPESESIADYNTRVATVIFFVFAALFLAVVLTVLNHYWFRWIVRLCVYSVPLWAVMLLYAVCLWRCESTVSDCRTLLGCSGDLDEY